MALASTVSPSSILICSISFRDGSDQICTDIVHRLEGYHDRPILSLDWAGSASGKDESYDDSMNGRIISCGEDCRAFVWKYDRDRKTFRASQVFMQQHATCFAPLYCHWNETGEKIVLAMAGNNKTASLQVCSFQAESKEWVARQVGRRLIKSSVLCASWRPTGSYTHDVVACGECDYRCRVFYVSEDDGDCKR